MNIVDMIERENKLRKMCSEVYGAQDANWHAQRLATRYEKEFREIADILVRMRLKK